MTEQGIDIRVYDNQREISDNTSGLVLCALRFPVEAMVFSTLVSKGVGFYEKCAESIQKQEYAGAALQALFCLGDAYAAFLTTKDFVKNYKDLKSLMEKRQALKEESRKLKMLDRDFDWARDSKAVR